MIPVDDALAAHVSNELRRQALTNDRIERCLKVLSTLSPARVNLELIELFTESCGSIQKDFGAISEYSFLLMVLLTRVVERNEIFQVALSTFSKLLESVHSFHDVPECRLKRNFFLMLFDFLEKISCNQNLICSRLRWTELLVEYCSIKSNAGNLLDHLRHSLEDKYVQLSLKDEFPEKCSTIGVSNPPISCASLICDQTTLDDLISSSNYGYIDDRAAKPKGESENSFSGFVSSVRRTDEIWVIPGAKDRSPLDARCLEIKSLVMLDRELSRLMCGKVYLYYEGTFKPERIEVVHECQSFYLAVSIDSGIEYMLGKDMMLIEASDEIRGLKPVATLCVFEDIPEHMYSGHLTCVALDFLRTADLDDLTTKDLDYVFNVMNDLIVTSCKSVRKQALHILMKTVYACKYLFNPKCDAGNIIRLLEYDFCDADIVRTTCRMLNLLFLKFPESKQLIAVENALEALMKCFKYHQKLIVMKCVIGECLASFVGVNKIDQFTPRNHTSSSSTSPGKESPSGHKKSETMTKKKSKNLWKSDGTRSVKPKPVNPEELGCFYPVDVSPGKSDLARDVTLPLKNEDEKLIMGSRVKFQPFNYHFLERNPANVSNNQKLRQAICAFLNSAKRGSIWLGVSDTNLIKGMELTEDEIELFSAAVHDAVGLIAPTPDRNCLSISFLEVHDSSGKLVADSFLIRLEVKPNSSGKIYREDAVIDLTWFAGETEPQFGTARNLQQVKTSIEEISERFYRDMLKQKLIKKSVVT